MVNRDTGLSGPTMTSKTWLCVLFKGTKLSLGLHFAPNAFNGSFRFWMDGYNLGVNYITLANSLSATEASHVKLLIELNSTSQELVDHQLLGYFGEAAPDRPIQIEVGTDNDIDANPSTFGQSALDVPVGNVIDDQSPMLRYSPGWSQTPPVFSETLAWNQTSTSTVNKGSWVEITFAGTGIWFFGSTGLWDVHLDIAMTEYTASGIHTRHSEHVIQRDRSAERQLFQAPLFNETNLAWTMARTYRITLISGFIALDYIRLQGNAIDPPQIDSVFRSSTRNLTPFIVGGSCALGVVLLSILVYLFFRIRRRRRNNLVGKEVGPRAPTRESFYAGHPLTAPCDLQNKKRAQQSEHSLWVTFDGIDSQTQGSMHTPTYSSTENSAFISRGQASEETYPRTSDSPQSSARILEDATTTTTTEGQALQLSHEDLARVFQRAKELKSMSSLGKLPASNESDGPLERLARSLAGV